MEKNPVTQTYESIHSPLRELGLWNENSQAMLWVKGKKQTIDAAGKPVCTDLFDRVKAPLAVVSSGPYSAKYAAEGKTAYAFTDDAAQMFGPRVRCVNKPSWHAPAFLIRDKGFMVTARFENELIAACILAEKMCMTEILSPGIGGITRLNGTLCTLEHIFYRKKYSRHAKKAAEEAAPIPQTICGNVPDLFLREAVMEYGNRLAANRLIQATWGNVSVRIDAERFLITPSGVDYDRIRPADVVEVGIADGRYAKGQRPSSERMLHQLVYQARPDIRAILHTHSTYCQIFAACRKDLKADGVDFPCAEYSVSGSRKLAKNVALVMRGHDGCIMANHGFVTGAETLEKALSQAIEAEQLAGEKLGIYRK